MRKLAIIALLLAVMPATAHAADYSSEAAWEAECSGTLRAFAQQEAAGGTGFMEAGVVEDNGRTYTWYSERVLPGGGLDELNANGRTVNESGYVVDGDGYIAVASPWGADGIGTVIETPFGMAKVYDACEGDSYDVYTSW